MAAKIIQPTFLEIQLFRSKFICGPLEPSRIPPIKCQQPTPEKQSIKNICCLYIFLYWLVVWLQMNAVNSVSLWVYLINCKEQAARLICNVNVVIIYCKSLHGRLSTSVEDEVESLCSAKGTCTGFGHATLYVQYTALIWKRPQWASGYENVSNCSDIMNLDRVKNSADLNLGEPVPHWCTVMFDNKGGTYGKVAHDCMLQFFLFD